MEGRTGDLIGLNLRSSLNNLAETFEQCWIGITAVSLGVFFLMPQANCDSVRSVGSDERNFVLETFLFSQQRKSFGFDEPVKLRDAIGLQTNRDTTSKQSTSYGWV